MRISMNGRVVLASAVVLGAVAFVLAGAGTGLRTPAAAAAAAASTAVRGGIVLDGVTGEGTAVPGGIDVLDFSDAVSSSVSTGAGGAGVGKATPTDLQVSGVLDAAYPVLFRNVTTGRHLATAVLTACTDPRHCAATAYLEIDLADAIVTKVVIGADKQVDLSLAFRQITWKFLRNGVVVSQGQFSPV